MLKLPLVVIGPKHCLSLFARCDVIKTHQTHGTVGMLLFMCQATMCVGVEGRREGVGTPAWRPDNILPFLPRRKYENLTVICTRLLHYVLLVQLPIFIFFFPITNAFSSFEHNGCMSVIKLSKITMEIRKRQRAPLALFLMFSCSCILDLEAAP
jgi:hypothetical protein